MPDVQKNATKEGLAFENLYKEVLKESNVSHFGKHDTITKFYDLDLDEPAHLDFVLPELRVVVELKTMHEWEKKHFQLIPSYAEKHKRGVFSFPNGEMPTFWYVIERRTHRSALKPKIISRTDRQLQNYNLWYNGQNFHIILYDHDTMKGLIHETKTARQG